MKNMIGKANADHLDEDVFGCYELCLNIGIPYIFPDTLNIRTYKSTELGKVEWKCI